MALLQAFDTVFESDAASRCRVLFIVAHDVGRIRRRGSRILDVTFRVVQADSRT